MGCIQTKKIIKIENSNQNEESKNDNNQVVIHNIRKDTTNNAIVVNNINNITDDKNEKEKNDQMVHSISENFKVIKPINDNQSKSNHSKMNGNDNKSMSNSEENKEIFKLTSNQSNNIIDKETKFEDKYIIVNQENIESFFKIYKVKLKNNNSSEDEYRTMIKIEKEIFGEFTNDSKIAEEISLLSKLDSKYIIKVYECFMNNKRYYLITDHCKYGSLIQKLESKKVYKENQIRYIVLQILKAIKYLTINNYLHIEISPEKILIDDIIKDPHGDELYNIKLLDFFCPSRNNLLPDNKLTFLCYMAPEVMEQKYSQTCDIWSIGIITFQLFFGELPYKSNIDYKEYVKNIKSTYNLSNNITNEFKDFLDKTLNKNPSRRMTIEECLSHPWVCWQNTDLIPGVEEDNNQQEITRNKNNLNKINIEKSHKSGKITNLENKQISYNSEHNSYKRNVKEPLDRNSSSMISSENSLISNKNIDKNDNYNDNDNGNDNDNDKDNDNDNINKENKVINEEEKLNNDNDLNEVKYNSNHNLNVIMNINNSKKKLNLKPEEFTDTKKSDVSPGNDKPLEKKSIKKVSSLSADKNHKKRIIIKFPPLIEKTIEYIRYYITINFRKKKEIEKITKIFNELDKNNNKYLLYDKVYFSCISYRENKKISCESFNNFDKSNINLDKKYKLEEFIEMLIDEKTKYVNNCFKTVFDSIKQPNIDEIIKIYKDQEPIDEYKKYIIYVKDFVKIAEDNKIKKNYFFNEFKAIVDTSINKIYTIISNEKINKSPKSLNKQKLRRAKTKKFLTDKIDKNKSPIKRSNTFLKKSKQDDDIAQKMKKKYRYNNPISSINLRDSKVYNLQFSEFSPDNFLKLTKK